MRMKGISRWLVFLALAYLVVSVAAGIFLAEAALHPGRRIFDTQQENIARQLAARSLANLEDVGVVAHDGVSLRAWSIQPHPGNGNSVILFHGMSDNRMGMIGYAELLLANGYGVLMPDSRAHGQSGGALATYGLLEKDDIQQWIRWVQDHQHPRCVFGFGESMGAAVVLQAIASKPGFCAVAAESPFASFREISYDRMGQFFHSGPWIGRVALRPTVEIALAYAKQKYDLDLQEISPEDSVATSSVPVFLIHGVVDRNIPLRHSKRIRARNLRVVLWEVPNAGHCGAISADPEQFSRKLLAWLRPPVAPAPNSAN